MSGSCLLKALSLEERRRPSQNRGMKKPISAPTRSAIGDFSGWSTKPRAKNRSGTARIAPSQIARYSLTLSLRSALAISRARFTPKSRCSTILLKRASATLWARTSLRPADDGLLVPLAEASGLPAA